jgi:ribosomal protein L13E
MYFVAAGIAAVVRPEYLLVSLSATIGNQGVKMGLYHLLVYVMAPEKAVGMTLAFGIKEWRLHIVKGILVLDVFALLAFLHALLVGVTPPALMLGYLFSIIGGVGTLCIFVTEADLRELKEDGWGVNAVMDTGQFTLHDLKEEGYTSGEMKMAGRSCDQAREAGYSCMEAREGDYSCKEAGEAGYSRQELEESYEQRVFEVTTYAALEEARKAEYTCEEVCEAGYSCEEAREAGYTCRDARQSHYSSPQLKACYSGRVFNAAGYDTCKEALKAGYSCKESREAGFSCKEAREAGYSLKDLRVGGYEWFEVAVFCRVTYDQLVKAGYTGMDRDDEIFQDPRFQPSEDTYRANEARNDFWSAFNMWA